MPNTAAGSSDLDAFVASHPAMAADDLDSFVASHPAVSAYGAGNIDLTKRPVVHNQDGSISTVRSRSFNIDSKEVLLPTISDDGRSLSDAETVDAYRKTGRNLGIFGTPEEATAYAKRLHEDQAAQYLPAHHGGASGSWDEPAQKLIPHALKAAAHGVDTLSQGADAIGNLAGFNPARPAVGVLKGALNTATGLYKLAGDVTGHPYKDPEAEKALETRNFPEAAGKFGEQVGEFMLGEGAVAKGLTKIPGAAKVAAAVPRIARAATGAISGAAVTKAQGGTNQDAAIAGVAGATLPAIIEGTAAGAKWLGQRLMGSALGITGKHAAAGADVMNLTKYGVARPTLGGTLDAIHEKITGLATQLRDITRGINAAAPSKPIASGIAADVWNPGVSSAGSHRAAVDAAIDAGHEVPSQVAAQYPELANKIHASGISGPKINLNDAVDYVQKTLAPESGQLAMSPQESQQVRSAIAEYRSHYSSLPNGPIVPIDGAQTAKRAAGLAGAWEYGKSAADIGREKVSNLIYGYLRGSIEDAIGIAGGELKAVNKALGDLIPLEQAAIRRMPIEARQAALSLTDWLLVATGHPIEAGARVAGKHFGIGIGAGMVKGAQGMRTATRPLTATMQEAVQSKDSNKPDDLATILRQGGQDQADSSLPSRGLKQVSTGETWPRSDTINNDHEYPNARNIRDENPAVRHPRDFLPPKFVNARKAVYGSPISGDIEKLPGVPNFPGETRGLFGLELENDARSKQLAAGRGPDPPANTVLIAGSQADNPKTYVHEGFHSAWHNDLTPADKDTFKQTFVATVKDFVADAQQAASRMPNASEMEIIQSVAPKYPRAIINYYLSLNNKPEQMYDEAFAESGSMYVTNPVAMKRDHPGLYETMRKIVGVEYTRPAEKRHVPTGNDRGKPHWEYPGGM